MKIGLVTWIGGGNYGTSLQSFALSFKLKQLGHNVYFPESYTPNLFKRKAKQVANMLGLLERKKKDDMIKRMPYNGAKLYEFISTQYKMVTPYSDRQFKKMVDTTDLFMTGSDQIWNVRYNFNPTMFLDFVSNKKRVAYASSIGIASIPDEYKPAVKSLLQKFDHIGVREESAVACLSEVVGRNDIVQVLDPTFLLTADDWTTMSSTDKYEIELPSSFILCYFVGNNSNYIEQIKEVKEKTGISNVIIIPSAEAPNLNIEGAIRYDYAGPKEFVDLIHRSKFVCTDSFHATAISINFSKDFVEFLRFKDNDSNSQNSRIYDVLSHYGLSKRMFNMDNAEWSKPIAYDMVQQILSEDRKNSMNYLINAIEN